MHKRSKNQSSIEYLSSFSLAIVILVIVVGIIAVLFLQGKTSTFTPSTCFISAQLDCQQFAVSSNALQTSAIAVFTNNLGTTMYFAPGNAFTVFPTSSQTYSHGECLPANAPQGSLVVCNAIIQNFAPGAGSQLQPRFQLSYSQCAKSGCPTLNTTGSAVVYVSPTLPLFQVELISEPSTANIVLNGVAYPSGSYVNFIKGITYNIASSYPGAPQATFKWVTSGGASVQSTTSKQTTASAVSSGVIEAVYSPIVSLSLQKSVDTEGNPDYATGITSITSDDVALYWCQTNSYGGPCNGVYGGWLGQSAGTFSYDVGTFASGNYQLQACDVTFNPNICSTNSMLQITIPPSAVSYSVSLSPNPSAGQTNAAIQDLTNGQDCNPGAGNMPSYCSGTSTSTLTMSGVNQGDTVCLTTDAAPGWTFSSYEAFFTQIPPNNYPGCGSSIYNPYGFTMSSSNIDFNANYNPSVSLSPNPSAGQSNAEIAELDSSGNPVQICNPQANPMPSYCSGTSTSTLTMQNVVPGNTVCLYSAAASGWTFSSYMYFFTNYYPNNYPGCGSSNNAYGFTMPSGITNYNANYNPICYSLTLESSTGGGTESVSSFYSGACTSGYQYGTSVTITATPASGYAFSQWTALGNGAYAGPNNPATITFYGDIIENAEYTSTAPSPGCYGTGFLPGSVSINVDGFCVINGQTTNLCAEAGVQNANDCPGWVSGDSPVTLCWLPGSSTNGGAGYEGSLTSGGFCPIGEQDGT